MGALRPTTLAQELLKDLKNEGAIEGTLRYGIDPGDPEEGWKQYFTKGLDSVPLDKEARATAAEQVLADQQANPQSIWESRQKAAGADGLYTTAGKLHDWLLSDQPKSWSPPVSQR